MKLHIRRCLIGLSVFVLAACSKSATPVIAQKAPPSVVAQQEQSPADDPKNVGGYGKTLWGMTEEEVLKAEAPRVERYATESIYRIDKGKHPAPMGIKSVDIGHSKYDVDFIFDAKDRKLIRVIVNSVEKTSASKNNDNFVEFLKLLTEKYGVPTFKDEGKADDISKKSQASWNLVKTSIELEHTHFIRLDASIFYVIYEPIEARKKANSDL